MYTFISLWKKIIIFSLSRSTICWWNGQPVGVYCDGYPGSGLHNVRMICIHSSLSFSTYPFYILFASSFSWLPPFFFCLLLLQFLSLAQVRPSSVPLNWTMDRDDRQRDKATENAINKNNNIQWATARSSRRLALIGIWVGANLNQELQWQGQTREMKWKEEDANSQRQRGFSAVMKSSSKRAEDYYVSDDSKLQWKRKK